MSQEQQEQETKNFFCAQNHSWAQNFFRTKDIFGLNIFGPKILFRPKKIFGPNMKFNKRQSLEGENKASELEAF